MENKKSVQSDAQYILLFSKYPCASLKSQMPFISLTEDLI